ncbi:MerR family transcriptional regulator [Actinomadura violacea]|uniref:MerR family transcriptional regulator n=1 Tax=Actinomadura violacea TaxID=2819934 RepID=A0ABS3S8N2_9ACTN|nr:MerR family transcriptional regulator [Actinomadura violacea]MBO2465357.1 MerR family transcriptional regulator [Actinomadura violacea]
MRIGELAAKTGVSVRSLRYYEQQGLLAAERSSSGQRHYPDSAVERVRLIQQLYAAGLSSKTIVDLIPCVVDGRATPELLAGLAAQRDHIDRHIADLTDTRNRLDSVITGAATNMLTGRSCRPGDTPQERTVAEHPAARTRTS